MIAIIAILAAVLFAVFAQAREKARQTSCLSNVKQLGLAAMMYVEDYDETYSIPYGVTTLNGNAYVQNWATDYTTTDGIVPGILQPYIKNNQIANCPSATKGDGAGLAYLYNDLIANKSQAVVAAPTDTVVMAESSVAAAIQGKQTPLTNGVGHAVADASGVAAVPSAVTGTDIANYAYAGIAQV